RLAARPRIGQRLLLAVQQVAVIGLPLGHGCGVSQPPPAVVGPLQRKPCSAGPQFHRPGQRRPHREVPAHAPSFPRTSSATGSSASTPDSWRTPSLLWLLPLSASRYCPGGRTTAVSRHPPSRCSRTGSRVASVMAPPRSKPNAWPAAGPCTETAS